MHLEDWAIELGAVTALAAIAVMHLVYTRVRARQTRRAPAARPRWQPIARPEHRPRDPRRLLDLAALEQMRDEPVRTCAPYDEPPDGVGRTTTDGDRGGLRS